MLGVARTDFRSNDDGEPSGTAGKPILGQINSRGLSDLVVIVVRYFGGIKLGTSGLIEAYRAATAEALDAAPLEERLVEEQVTASLDYALMGDVMRIAKEEGATLLNQEYGERYRLTLSLRRAGIPRLKSRLSLIYGVTVEGEA
jgi:putative IMPACT (imprinted ancient) family translation regulator